MSTPSPSSTPNPDQQQQRETSWLSPSQLQSFFDTGILVIPATEAWSKEELKLLLDSANEMDNWPDQAGKWMKYYESNSRAADGSKMLQRIENFTQYNPGMDTILNGSKLLGMVSELFQERAVLYKEKINYKLPGGSGFAPHQDISAGWWMYNQTLHISALITIDEANSTNGCLEVVYGKHKEGKLAPDWKEIPQDVCDTLKWVSTPTKPGDIVFFDSYVPHRSGPNNTDKPRRVLYSTYAKLSEGDYRDKYYADKRVSFPPDIEREADKVYEYKI